MGGGTVPRLRVLGRCAALVAASSIGSDAQRPPVSAGGASSGQVIPHVRAAPPEVQTILAAAEMVRMAS